ncbi:protein transport protein Sec24D [Microplitis demolitor]|uniref:protein transport protein Sec24D n=1 Tax=Microplitis demolitor TaxID=69319 RepID=UPI000440007D|nr:protein transport protein Sec24D [Microplitis demolitor]
MNQQYMQQPLYGQPRPGYDGLNSNVPNMKPGAPGPGYPGQKVPAGNQGNFYNYQGDPGANGPAQGTAGLTNQMSNMSIAPNYQGNMNGFNSDGNKPGAPSLPPNANFNRYPGDTQGPVSMGQRPPSNSSAMQSGQPEPPGTQSQPMNFMPRPTRYPPGVSAQQNSFGTQGTNLSAHGQTGGPPPGPGPLPPTGSFGLHGQTGPGQLPPTGPPGSIGQPGTGQLPPGPGQLPPTQHGPGQLPPTGSLGQPSPGQLPPTQHGPGQLPPAQHGPGQLPPAQHGPGQLPPGSGQLPSVPGQLPPAQHGPGQLPPGPGQLPPGPGQLPPGPGQLPPGQPGAYQQNINYQRGPPLPGQPAPFPPNQSPLRQPYPPYQQPPNYQAQPQPPTQPQPPYPYQDPYRSYHPQQGVNMPGAQPFQPGAQPAQAKRLDPESMPSPIQVMQDDQKTRGGTFITNQKGLVPPFVTTKFVVQDQGNASPRFIRSTIYTVPTTTDMMKQTGVPFGLILSPMAKISEGEQEPPIVDMGEVGPIRCNRCKAYMSPFMQFIDAGRRFQCSFCKATTDVPQEYFQHLDHTGQRMDRFERPELMLGTYEYLATKDYCRNNTFPSPPAMIFVIDVSYNNIKSGMVALLCRSMKEIISNLPRDTYSERTNMRVGFITYSTSVHFYNVSACLTQPQMMVVGDVQDVFMPLLDGFLVDPEESAAVIDSLMQQIPAMFAETRETETILAPAIQAGLEACKAYNCAGKLLVFHSSLPNAEAPGKLKNRDDRKLLGTDKEKTVLAPQNSVYNNLGQDCVGAGCSVDLFVFNNSYIDLATIGQVCRLTGGEIFKYTYFQADTDGERLVQDIINDITRPIAFDAVMRVRTSTGVRPTDFYGHFFMSNTTDMELAAIDCNKAIAVEVKHDDKLTEEEGVYVQVALLYTSVGGVRRLRIINLSLRTSSQMTELYRTCDPDAIVNFFAKQSVVKIIENSPKTIKDQLVARCAMILAAYRKHCASPFSASQLVLPECMKLLPLYVNCLLKSDALSGGSDMTIDDRSFVMQAVVTMPLYTSVIYFYPRLLPLHDLDTQAMELPQQLRCSFDKFTDDGAFLLENGIHMFMWFGLSLSTEWIQAVFGTPVVDTDRSSIPILDNPLNKRVRDIVNRVRMERYHCMRLTFVRQRDKLEMVLRHFLVEDRNSDSSPSYVDFLCHMHKEIKTLLNQ